MLGLSHKIRGDKPGIAMLGQYDHLCWTGEEINSAIERDLLLCCGHIKIAWTYNLVDARHRASSVGQSGNCLCPSDSVELANFQEMGSGECLRHRTRRDDADLAHSRNLSRDYSHQYCRRKRVAAARNITAGRFQWTHHLPQSDAFRGCTKPFLRLLPFAIATDVCFCFLQRLLELLRSSVPRLLELEL